MVINADACNRRNCTRFTFKTSFVRSFSFRNGAQNEHWRYFYVNTPKRQGFKLTFRDQSKRRDVRTANIDAARALADAVRTSLGPRGMDKMVKRNPSSR